MVKEDKINVDKCLKNVENFAKLINQNEEALLMKASKIDL